VNGPCTLATGNTVDKRQTVKLTQCKLQFPDCVFSGDTIRFHKNGTSKRRVYRRGREDGSKSEEVLSLGAGLPHAAQQRLHYACLVSAWQHMG